LLPSNFRIQTSQSYFLRLKRSAHKVKRSCSEALIEAHFFGALVLG
jgi:hypothetical protein